MSGEESHCKSEAQQRTQKTVAEGGNLIPFKPGVSGNPAGSPKHNLIITSQVRKILEADAGGGKTVAEIVAGVIVKKLREDEHSKGYATLLKDQQDRLEGKVTEQIAVTQKTTVRFIVGKGYAKDDDKPKE